MPISTETPARAGQIGPDRPEPALEMRLLSVRLVFRNLAEFRQAMRHRYVLANCLGLTVPAIALIYALGSTQLPIDLQVPSVVVALVAAQMLVMSYLALASRLARGLCRNERVVRIWVTPALTLGAAVMLWTAHGMHRVMGAAQDWTELQSHLMPFLCVLYLEVAATILFRGPLPRALAKLREGQPPLDLPTDLAEVRSRAEGPAMAERSVPDGLLRQSAALGISLTDILRLEASGNYVTVVTRKGRHLLPGPFSAAVAQMPQGMGRQVQRSHWVSLAAVEGVRRQGRDLWLQVTCGAQVPVSAAKRGEVQAWLEAHGKLVPAARMGGAGLSVNAARMQGATGQPERSERVE